MDVNDLVIFCDQNWESPKCSKGCHNVCKGHCISCLEHIHKVSTHDRTYNCSNIVYCYTCKYIYKYSSEVFHILTLMRNVLKQDVNIKAASIGCGPASELMGLSHFRKLNDLQFGIEYKGFDKSVLWKPIHDKILDMNSCDSIEFIYQDIFEYYKNNVSCPNLLILNYVLSDVIRRSSGDDFNVFLNSLVNLIKYMPKDSFIIVNDINYGVNSSGARYHYPILCEMLESHGVEIKAVTRNFASSEPYYFHCEREMKNNQLVMEVPKDICKKYNPWSECRSAFLIVKKLN